MGKTFGVHPEMSWSNKRDEVFKYCERQYYLHYYHSWLGWTDDPDIDDSRRVAYRLKKLTSLHAVLGDVVHKLCEERIAASRAGAAWMDEEEIRARTILTLREACIASRDRTGFLERPSRKGGMLQSYYYVGKPDPSEVEAVRAKLEPCVRHLVTHPIWDELAALPPDAVLAVERQDSFLFDGVPVWVKADLIYEDREGIVVLDWKTRSDDEYPARPVLALYALYARDVLRVPWMDGGWRGRVVNLVTGNDREYPLSRVDLIRAEGRIRESLAQMRQVLEDEDANKPMSIEHYPLANPAVRARCQYCPFIELCAPELSRGRGGQSEVQTGGGPAWDRRDERVSPPVVR